MARRIKNVFKRMGIAMMKSRLEYAKRQVALLGYHEIAEDMKAQIKEH